MLQSEQTFESPAGRLSYLLSLPSQYGKEPGQRWPFVLFLHGRGERGSDLALVKREGLPCFLETADDSPFITVSPQCPPDSDWFDQQAVLSALLDDVTARYGADLERVYLTGLSMGGRGSWHLAVREPERFAALAPICGRIPDLPNFFELLPVLKNMPIWVFHGALDQTVPIENSDRIVAALREYGSDVRYTIYPDADHDSWTVTYNNPELYSWLLAQRRSSS